MVKVKLAPKLGVAAWGPHMTLRTLGLRAACALGVLGATAASAQEGSLAQDTARTTQMAAEAAGEVTIADAFTPGPADPPPTPLVRAPASQPTYRNPWTTPRPSLREAFARMAASFKGEFREPAPPADGLELAEGPEPVFDRAEDLDFTVADAFDPRRPGAPAASGHGVQAAAQAGAPDDGVARARSLNLAAAEKNKDAASAIAAHEAAQREYENELARWREQLDR